MSDKAQSEREFFRTGAKLSLRFGPDTQEGRRSMTMDEAVWRTQSELEEASRRTLEDGEKSPELAPVLAMLRYLDYKVDLILHHLRSSVIDSHFPHHTYTTDISGSGLAVQAHSELRLGERVLISLSLPDLPSRPIFAAAKVVRSDGGGQGEIGLALEEISESDRERLVRLTFARQREELARRSQEEDR